MPASPATRPNSDHASLGVRLDCWKEIASYLGRGERTVKRWETERGLPIRRLPGGGRSSVYAFAAELDEWLQSSRAEEFSSTHEDREEPSLERLFLDGSEPQPDASSESAAHVQEPAVVAVDSWHAAVVGGPVAGDESASVEKLEPALASGWRARGWMVASGVLLLLILPSLAWRSQRVRSFAAHASSSMPKGLRQKPAGPPATSRPEVTEAEKRTAQDLYLKGRYEWNMRSPESLNRALDAFTQAIVHDPGYAEAYVGLADTYNLLREYSSMPDEEAFLRSTAAAKKAVELDDSLAAGHRALAFAEMYGSWDFADAEKEFRRAIALNPNDPIVHRWYANAIAVPGRFEESLREIDRAQELDPTSHSTLADKGIMLFNSGHSQEAIELLEQVEQSSPDFQSTHKYLMRIDFETQNYPAYLSEGKTAAELDDDPVLKGEIAAAKAGYTSAGKNGLLRALYAKQRVDYAEGKLWATILAQTCMQMGRKREALALLEEDYAHHQEYVVAASLADPVLLELRDEAGYQALVKKINFPSHA